jgi:hypothetical protein
MIRSLYEKLVTGKKKKPSRAEVLASRPFRNPSVTWERQEREGEGDNAPREPVALLKVPRRKDKWGNLAARFFKIPDFKKIELDEIGSDVWERCDGTLSVEAITKAICAKYRLNRRQGETSVTAYLRMLAERRLVAVRTNRAKMATGQDAAAGTTTGAVAAAAAAKRTVSKQQRRQKRA